MSHIGLGRLNGPTESESKTENTKDISLWKFWLVLSVLAVVFITWPLWGPVVLRWLEGH